MAEVVVFSIVIVAVAVAYNDLLVEFMKEKLKKQQFSKNDTTIPLEIFKAGLTVNLKQRYCLQFHSWQYCQ